MNRRTPTQSELGIWLGAQAASDGALFNTAECLHIKGPLDEHRFSTLVQRTLEGATALHQRFLWRDGAVWCEEATPEADASWLDLSAADAPELSLRQLQKELGELSFALDRGPLFASRLVKLSDSEYAWVLVVHHIALDGMGFHLLLSAAIEDYASSPADEEVHDAPRWPSAHLEDFSATDVSYQASERRQKDALFWQNRLENESAVRWGRPESTARALSLEVPVTPSTMQRLEAHAAALNVPFPDLLLAVGATFTRLVTGRTRFTLGVPVLGRLGTPVIATPCMAMNIVPLVAHVRSDSTVPALARELRATFRGEQRHHRFRYEHLPRAPDGVSPFGPVINLLPLALPSEMGTCRLRHERLSAGPVQDLALVAHAAENSWNWALDVNPAVFPKECQLALARQLAELLEAVARTPERTIDDLVRDFVATPVRAPALLTQLEEHARRSPDALAVVAPEQSLSYAELHRAARAAALDLQERGIAPGDWLLVDVPRGALACILMLAAHLARAGYAFMPTDGSERGRVSLRAQLAPRLTIALGEPSDESERNWTLSPDCIERWLTRAPTARSLEPRESHDPAYAVSTSGSTGLPKVVGVMRGALDHFVAAALPAYGVLSSDRVLQFAALSFDASVEEVWVTWAAGATLVIRPEGALDSVGAFLRWVEAQQLTILDLPTAFWNEVTLGESSLPHTVRTVIIGGEAAHPRSVARFRERSPGVRLLNSYGPSEATIVATVADLSLPESGSDSVPIGAPLVGVTTRVVDAEGTAQPEGAARGELWLGGPTLAQGYLGDLARTTARFTVTESGERFYRTGDLVRRDEVGSLYFEGRVDDEFKISGVRIALAEVEAALVALPGVRAAVVRGVIGERGERRLVAHVETSAPLTLADLRAQAASRLDPVALPTALHVWESLPKNAHGKLDRARLDALASTAEAPTPPQTTATSELPSLTSEESAVAELWRELLGVTVQRADEDFFALGGDSLKLIQLASRLSRPGFECSVAKLFQNPTVRAQARLRASTGESSASPFEFTRVELTAQRATEARSARLEHVLLTGGTGFLGVHLLNALLDAGIARITCLVRPSAEAGAERLLEAAHSQHLALDPADPRVHFVVESDLERLFQPESAPSLILHAAAEVSLARDYSSLLAPNVLLTRRLLDHALTVGAAFHYVSTIATLASDQAEEQFFAAHPELTDGYQRSKWQAEDLCRKARERGLSVAVHRLGRVAGARRVPTINERDLVWRIARAAARIGVFPDLPVSEPWTPVDELAETMVALVLATGNSTRLGADHSGVYHFVHQGDVTFRRVHEALERTRGPLPLAPLDAFLEQLSEDEHHESVGLRALFAELKAPKRSTAISCSALERALPHLDRRPVDDALLDAHCRLALVGQPGGAQTGS